VDALRRLAERRLESFEVWLTEGPGHATVLAAKAAAEGFEVVVAVGGDGTANEVVNGLVEVEGTAPVFAVVPGGTGSDLVRSLEVPKDAEAAVDLVVRGTTRPTDLVRVRLQGHDGDELVRCCINVFGIGMSGEVVRRANLSSKRLGGTATFLGATLGALMSYRSPEIRISWVGAEGEDGAWSGRLLTGFVANGHYCGGGMWVGRGGSMHDGLLELSVVPPLGIVSTATGLPHLYDGKLDQVKGVLRTTVREIKVEAIGGPTVLVEVDGEQPGTLPLSASVLPEALLVRAGW
jgi:YegS/Rv2252/BmrU family lipid kinase